MELDERVMDKILADVKEIVAEADGTLRFIFYSPYSEEVEEDGEPNDELRKKDKELAEMKKVLEGFRADVTSANEDLLERNRQIFALSRKNSEKTEEISNLKAKIVEKENYITKLMIDIESKDATIKLLEQKLAGGRND
jgi:hypothetical protein